MKQTFKTPVADTGKTTAKEKDSAAFDQQVREL